jgi:serine phosphatase RsbU (regulator of sigma subunit)
MGGDLFAAARTTWSTRLLIGDVRGNGLPAYNHAALLLGAFRAASHRQAELPALARHLDGALRWDAEQWGPEKGVDAEEAFATAAMVDIPDEVATIDLISAGHPPPLLLRRAGTVEPLHATRATLPIGFGTLDDASAYQLDTFTFGPGDTLLLYTDGVTEARDAHGTFYALPEHAREWIGQQPDELLRRLREDLMRHTNGNLRDDAAAVAVLRAPDAPATHAAVVEH